MTFGSGFLLCDDRIKVQSVSKGVSLYIFEGFTNCEIHARERVPLLGVVLLDARHNTKLLAP